MQPHEKAVAYAHRIRKAYPKLQIASLRLDQGGQNNDVLFINDDLIFRFPRYESGIAQIERETAILRAVQRYVTLSVPNPLYTSFQPATVGKVFLGYRLIQGSLLSHETLARLGSVQHIQVVADQLAAFLKQLHSVPLEEVVPTMEATRRIVDRWADLYSRIQQRLFTHMRPDARDWTIRHFETFLHDPRNQSIAPVLTHGDFGAGNIVYDPETLAIAGVIDFGSAGPDDPAVDFAAASTIADGFLERFYPAYPDIERALDRMRFYRGTFALQEALFGIENDDDEAFRAGMADFIP